MKKKRSVMQKNIRKFAKLVPDTSVLIEGLVSARIRLGELQPTTILIHEAVLSELEHQANQNRETGFLGIEEIKRLRDLSAKYRFQIIYTGVKPEISQIRMAKSGWIDALIRDLAAKEHATLFTADKVQAQVAEAKGVSVILAEFEQAKQKTLRIEQYFDATTMSVHLRENLIPAAKKGLPGIWEFVHVGKAPLSREEVKDMAKEIVEETGMRTDGFIEIERKGSTIVQLGNFRIVITKPPLSDGWEITIVRPIRKTTLQDYTLSDKLAERIMQQAEGILIAGAPGMGKSTFAQALAEHYAALKKIVKTVEAPRDLQLSDNITQYSISHGSSAEIHDILLLTRPDYTIYDEMRNTEDFKLYADLRLSGVGMVGIVHATKPIDAIQRFIGRIEMGVIPQIVDTVLFINKGAVEKAFSVKMEVKVPHGMTEEDLARPIVTITDFETGVTEYEIYSYGEETIVVPITASSTKKVSGARALAASSIEHEFKKFVPEATVEMVSEHKCVVYVPEHFIAGIIGKGGSNIEKIEKHLGVSIEVRELEQNALAGKEPVQYHSEISKKNVKFIIDSSHQNKDIDIYVGNDYLLSAKVGNGGVLKIKKTNKIARVLIDALNAHEDVKLVIA